MSINIPTLAGFFRHQPACWVQASGPDAANFLQGQCTNDLKALGKIPVVYGLWLNVRGKVVADSFVLRGTEPDTFWIGSYRSPAAVIVERLEAFIIADDVTLEDATASWSAVSVIGPEGEGRLKASGPTEGFIFPGRRIAGGGVEWIFPAAMAATVGERLAGLPEMAAVDLERARIAAAIPSVPMDLGPGDLPNEGGLETDAISFTKGCYLGQEVMARLKSMGRIRRRLLRVRGSGAIPPRPARLFAQGRAIGELRSAIGEGADGWIGLALLSLVNLAPKAELALAADAAPTVRLLDLP